MLLLPPPPLLIFIVLNIFGENNSHFSELSVFVYSLLKKSDLFMLMLLLLLLLLFGILGINRLVA